jgi:hypothetical protein
MSQQDIEQIELSVEHAKEMVERKKLALQLADNPAFKKLILDGYFRDEAARLAHLLSDPALPAEHREFVRNDINGPGALKRFMSTIVRMGDMAEREIADAELELDELRREEESEG